MILVILLFSLSQLAFAEARPINIGSKKFTESVILAEIARLALEHEGLQTHHKAELGGTRMLWNALRGGDIDTYVDYTGTLAEEILKEKVGGFSDLRSKLAKHGVGALPPLGFNNTYAVGMKRALAKNLGIQKISDLALHPQLKIAWGDEFRLRTDGWPGLKEHYKLPQQSVRGMDHDIAYRAMESGDIEVTDLYSTDAEINYYDLLVLKDDLDFFPDYEAVFLFRLDQTNISSEFLKVLDRLTGRIDENEMIAMNRRAKIDKVPADELAANFLNKTFNWQVKNQRSDLGGRILLRTAEHLRLVLISLAFAILFAVPLGVLAQKFSSFGRLVLWGVGVIQTIPALALLVVLIKPLNLMGLSGIGDTPALIALFLYSLLPIVRSTHSGLDEIPMTLRETATVLALRQSRRLLRIELPLAMPAILSGIKTAAVFNVGFATLGALVGAGGYGQPILSGIRLDDYGQILEGSIPAAIMALCVQLFFDFLEKRVVSPGLRI